MHKYISNWINVELKVINVMEDKLKDGVPFYLFPIFLVFNVIKTLPEFFKGLTRSTSMQEENLLLHLGTKIFPCCFCDTVLSAN